MLFESIFFGLLLAAALVPFLPRNPRPFLSTVAALATVLIAAAGASAWSTHKAADERRRLAPDGRPFEASVDGYVSSDACRSCHPGEHATWHESFHRTMTQVASPETVLGDFDGVELEHGRGVHRLERTGDEFWVEMPDPTVDGPWEQRPRVRRRIVMITGSHHYQVYWYPSGDSRVIWSLPFVYLIDEQQWIPRGAAFLGPPEKTASILGVWNRNCVKCHSTRGQPALADDRTMDTRAAEFGISCEACHGPGAEHVRLHRDPLARYGQHLEEQPDESIVHPGRLTHRRSTEVCGQCHGIWRARDRADWTDWLRRGTRFRPGDELADSALVLRHQEAATSPEVRHALELTPSYRLKYQYWSDGMVRVSGREYNGLLETPCFEDGEMSCLSCHELHRDDDDPRPAGEWTNDQLKPGMDGDEACLQCHEKFRTNLVEHTHHEPDSTGSRCYECHMPHTTYGLLKAIRSHEVDSPDARASVATGRPDACSQCHLDRTLAWTAKHLEDWYEIPAPELSEDEANLAAAVLWTLRGDAGQRALMAWSMGWAPAMDASGEGWMEPHLIQLLDDPYEAVRWIAARSLRERAAFADFEYDFVAPRAERHDAIRRAMARWVETRAPYGGGDPAPVLLDTEGRPRRDVFARLLRERNDSEVQLHE